MEELKRVGVFTKVVQAQSFSEAARRLGVAKSAVSKQISLLEQEVGVRLLNRSTRKLSLTEAGEIYYRHCEQIVNRADIALNELRQYQNQPTGTLRVSSPVPFGRALLIPVIKELRSLYPLLKIDLQLNDQVVNMVEDGIDLTVRIGQLPDSNLIAKKLCDTSVVLFASPEYLARCGTPQTPMDLAEHQWISLSILSSPIVGSFSYKITGKPAEHQINSSLKINSVDAVIDAAVQGLGISALVKTVIHEELRTGKLIPVLQEYELAPRAVYALYPHREHLPPKVRIFMDFLEKHCANADWALPRK
ncbi:LysR family transcriptional regulator [Psychromonas aquimarina]|uniref:LysR family transcriptional regulator n=1 Tax=Psychromonas aquimarina TaxID=444919 RepID=UPI00040B6753|nr:LysR family transcriptional regulator [Psychromonas aquimarina]